MVRKWVNPLDIWKVDTIKCIKEGKEKNIFWNLKLVPETVYKKLVERKKRLMIRYYLHECTKNIDITTLSNTETRYKTNAKTWEMLEITKNLKTGEETIKIKRGLQEDFPKEW